METKGVNFILVAIIFVGGLFVPTKSESITNQDCCPYNPYTNDTLMHKAEAYLQSLKEENKNNYYATCNDNDSLHYVVKRKDLKIKSLKKELTIKPKEIIITKVDTIVVKEKRNFWGKTKIDTIK